MEQVSSGKLSSIKIKRFSSIAIDTKKKDNRFITIFDNRIIDFEVLLCNPTVWRILMITSMDRKSLDITRIMSYSLPLEK